MIHLCFPILLFVYSLYFARKFKEIYYLHKQRKSIKVVFQISEYKTNCLVLLAFFFVCLLISTPVLAWKLSSKDLLSFSLGATLLGCGFSSLRKLTSFEIAQINFNNNLNVGYGAAIWYYKNYLKKIVIPNLLKRIKEFESNQRVKLPHKLYILCPHSCKIKKDIDDTEFIERCREMTTKTSYSGVHDREYNITVYQVHHPEDPSISGFRCAVEYAQPLKTLMHFKDYGRITLEEMHLEHDRFCLKLKELLIESSNLFELLQFDDENNEVYDVLYRTNSTKAYLKSMLM